MARRSDLAEFLRARRSALAPGDVGLPAGARRRTAGLRREEVAMLAGVSVSWYTWLEQGRPIRPSADVLDALARVLRFDEVERVHLYALAELAMRPNTPGTVRAAPSGVLMLLDALMPSPAYVLNERWDVLAWNAAQDALFPSFGVSPAQRPNLVRVIFCDVACRSLIGDWEREARRILSQFRADVTPIRDRPDVTELVASLRADSAEFCNWWPLHDVAGFVERERIFHHTVAGLLRFYSEQVIPAADPDLRLVVHLPIDGDDSTDRLNAIGPRET